MHYTGIGSRDVPEVYQNILRTIAKSLAEKGYTLRSGGAKGADTAFEEGALDAKGKMEIYLPWGKFNGRSDKEDGYYSTRDSHYDFYKKAKEVAAKFHPAWDNLNDGSKMLHTRNVHQILGLDVETPSKFLVCYSEANAPYKEGFVGGTGQALRIATSLKLPIYNLANEELARQCLEMLKTI